MDPDPEPSARYESYLLRLRRAQRDGKSVCQAMLQSVATKEKRYFPDLESMVAFLQTQAQGQGKGKPGAQDRKEETM